MPRVTLEDLYKREETIIGDIREELECLDEEDGAEVWGAGETLARYGRRLLKVQEKIDDVEGR